MKKLVYKNHDDHEGCNLKYKEAVEAYNAYIEELRKRRLK